MKTEVTQQDDLHSILRDICEKCDGARSIDENQVDCRFCRFGKVELKSGDCPLGRWPYRPLTSKRVELPVNCNQVDGQRDTVRKASPSKIYCVASVFDTPEIVPHFCRHYSKLGVDSILLASNVELDESALCREFPKLVIRRTHYSEFNNHRKHEGERLLLDDVGVQPDDWVMHLDMDEFHEYPAHIRDLCDIMDSRNIWAIKGQLLDRTSESGVLIPIHESAPIDRQFPLGARLTRPLIGGEPTKVMLARRKVRLTSGRHDTENARLHRWPIGHIDQYKVHHFRWTSGLIARLESRWKTGERSHPGWVRGNLNFLDQYRREGRINLGNGKYDVCEANSLIYPSRSSEIQTLVNLKNPYGFDEHELEQLAEFVGKHGILKVLEFGPGYSTIALAGCGCGVTSLESDTKWFRKAKDSLRSYSSVDVHQYECGYPIKVNIPDEMYDLGVIDGPPGKRYPFISRLDSAQYAMERCRTLAVHDANREGEQRLIQYLVQLGWRVQHQVEKGRGLKFLTQPSLA